MKRREALIAGALLPSLTFFSARAHAQAAYPNRPISWVVGFAPGGGADAITRMVVAKVAQNIGQPINVENRPGASSIIAAQHVVNSPPDGYTLLSAEQSVLMFNAVFYSKLPYDPTQLVPISNMIRAPLVLVVHPSFPASDFNGFIEHARRNAGKLSYASPGRGLSHHLAMEALKKRAGLEIVDVHYKGIAPALQDAMSGQVPICVADTVVALQQIRSGKLRALASFANKRLAVLPDVPALGELGLQDIDIAPIVGAVAARGVPREVVTRISAEMQKAIRDPEIHARLTGMGLEVIGDTPEQFAAFIEREAKLWVPIARSLNIKLD